MIRLIRAETSRLLARRITWGFPTAIAVLIAIGVVIAYIFTSNGDISLVNDFDGQGRSEIVGLLFPIMTFVLGASFIGADLKSGMLEHLLTWEPHRSRLLLARLIGGAIVVAGVVAVLYVLLTGALSGLAVLRDGAEGVDQDWWLDVLSGTGRACLVGVALFAMGVALATIMNSSVGAIVSFVIYSVVVEGVLVFLPEVWRWLPLVNAGSFGGASDVPMEPLEFFAEEAHHAYGWSGLIMAAYAIALVIPAMVVFTRRDIS